MSLTLQYCIRRFLLSFSFSYYFLSSQIIKTCSILISTKGTFSPLTLVINPLKGEVFRCNVPQSRDRGTLHLETSPFLLMFRSDYSELFYLTEGVSQHVSYIIIWSGGQVCWSGGFTYTVVLLVCTCRWNWTSMKPEWHVPSCSGEIYERTRK